MALTDQVVVITGGSRGLGFAYAQALAEAGARIAITGRSADALQQARAQLNCTPAQIIAVRVDVTDP